MDGGWNWTSSLILIFLLAQWGFGPDAGLERFLDWTLRSRFDDTDCGVGNLYGVGGVIVGIPWLVSAVHSFLE
jgi:hypothetical protein